ncbi:brachyurin [Culex quinquefasciatus]|uniref:brachyurin n=1 Tax=Culex quinquefasciatus TaxID=7176 RepID=UPI0018E33F5F|nr:brachyurin [Culex quinquefasciatus]XP_039438857.1 brachyurin-like [Culex pipiens pallens]
MKSFALLVAILAVASAEWIEIDWSQVRPIEDFDHYWARLPAELQFLRKLQPERRITNGQEATPGQFPYQIALLSTFGGGTGLCGGSVLTNNFILTAAHCVQNAMGGTAIMGAHNRINNEATQQRIAFGVNGINIHAGYTPTNIRNDIATVRLNSPITFNDRVQPVRIPAHGDNRQFAGLTGTVSGFGRTSDASQATSAVVMFTSNPIMTQADCLASWGNNANLIQAQNICMSGAGGRSACNGDSGGPLSVAEGGTLQVGIVSFGSAAGCSIGMPSVYVRVTHFLEWIQANSDHQH